MTRVNIIKGLGPVLQIAEGWSVELPKDVHDILNKRTTQPGQPPGLHRASPVKGRLRMCTR